MSHVSSSRILSLDGLRAIAIFIVFTTHIQFTYLYQVSPSLIDGLLHIFTANGKVGVGLLFMLSGFLMSTVYSQVPSVMSFYQKRYTRLFPTFLTMCVVSTVYFLYGSITSTAVTVLSLLIVPYVFHHLWIALQSSHHREIIGRILFKAFLITQVIVAIVYGLVVWKVPAAVFYQVLPDSFRYTLYFLVNATLTTPVGRYVPQVDGVYWSLITEVCLYLLYPILFIPIINTLKVVKSKLLLGLMMLSSAVFLYMLQLVFENFLGLAMIQIQLGIYFLAGICLAHIFNHPLTEKVKQYLSGLPTVVTFILGICLLLSYPYFIDILPGEYLLESILWVIPTACAFLLATWNWENNGWMKFLQHPVLTHLGEVSFSLYVTHSLAISLVYSWLRPASVYVEAVANITSFLFSLSLAWYLHTLMEKPYFNKMKEKITSVSQSKKQQANTQLLRYLNWKIVATLSTSYLAILWFTYQTPVTPTAIAFNHTDKNIQHITLLTAKPLQMNFTAEQNNLGMIMLELKPLGKNDQQKLGIVPGSKTEEYVVVKVKNNDAVITENRYALKEIYHSKFHPVGMPVVADSIGKQISVEVSLSSDDTTQKLALVNASSAFRAVYFRNKSELVSNPGLLFQHLTHKLVSPFSEKEALTMLALFLPLFAVLAYLTHKSSIVKHQLTSEKK